MATPREYGFTPVAELLRLPRERCRELGVVPAQHHPHLLRNFFRDFSPFPQIISWLGFFPGRSKLASSWIEEAKSRRLAHIAGNWNVLRLFISD